MGFPGGTNGKDPTCQSRRHKGRGFDRSLCQEDPLEEGVATPSSMLAWRTPWTEEPGGLQSMGSQRVRHNWSDPAHTHSVANCRHTSGLQNLFILYN